MARLTMNFACGGYDRMQALREGIVQPEGIDLEFLTVDSPREIFDRMSGQQAFDSSEMSASEFIAQTGAGDCPFVALPVFPSKAFRHGFICINRRSGIREPKDLEGKRVGVPLYTQTASIWIRGHLQDDYGVDLEKVRWLQGAVEKVGTHGTPAARPLLKPVPIEVNETGRSLSEMLAEGEIDALLGSRLPDSLRTRPEDVVRLFPDYRAVERELYLRTRIHPIMHLVAIRRDVYDANPWIGKSLYAGCEDSKRWALDKMKASAAQRYMLPWLFPDLDEIDEVFGGDPWPYGVEANRPTLEALMRYMVQQNFIAEAIPIDDLFVPV